MEKGRRRGGNRRTATEKKKMFSETRIGLEKRTGIRSNGVQDGINGSGTPTGRMGGSKRSEG